ncbi:sulfide/dihydroorotate dehydrogenase-like FAD/NAD-binding protein [Schnuerera sp. xch1]|uniref:sulfide/dihydroorotate dehydrogenase-like FAD/NAD-binding protein n=1 Tax=Schnuerera sp. xch1 TaxID=2874283 RepID=UPI002958DF1D|nr:sulfide/dihydroorotate dehydrogenase-like FAD/NAD-binding protein [Schnuerera sp. xch1]MBZ2174132.1 sulfide/dihydroorotate dehydrogenase-like FAD/NAD-binding protein [Schnuerera sp. xch1]
MYKIVKKKDLAPNIFSMDILAPRVADSAQPGQFLIVIVDEIGERIPLTICDYDREKGTVNIVVQTAGASTKRIAVLNEGDYLKDVVGPLGEPSEYINEDIEEVKKKKILFVAGGVGAAPVYPQVKWFRDHDIDVDVIIGAKTKELIILENEMKKVAGKLYIATDDGSYGFNGMVTGLIEDLVKNQGKEYDLIVSIGPMIMMKFVCLLTKKLGIKTIVSLNPIMVDGTGMCGACRVTVGDETKFACVDGPEFDGHLVDFDEALKRQAQYKKEEAELAERGEQKICTCQHEHGGAN